MNKTPESPQILPKFKKINIKRLTPHLDLNQNNSINIREIKRNDASLKSFSTFIKQIVDTNNENFLSGDINIIEYLISKNCGIPINDVKSLEKLSLRINKDFDLLNQFGQYLPNLIELRLNNSGVASIGDVGSSFKNLRYLQICNCNLTDLAGMICFQQLEVLDLSHNKISDLIELEMCSSIIKLNLKDNLVEDSENISFLSGITALKWLNLNDNPIKKLDNYEELIKERLPDIETLDKEEEILKTSNSTLDDSNFDDSIMINNKQSLDSMINKTKSTIASNSFSSRPATATTNVNQSQSKENLTSTGLVQGVKALYKSRVRDDFNLEATGEDKLRETTSYFKRNSANTFRERDSLREKSVDFVKKIREEKKQSNQDSLILKEEERTVLPSIFKEGGKFKLQKSFIMKHMHESHGQEPKSAVKIEGDTSIFNKAFKKIDQLKQGGGEDFKILKKNIVIKSSKINID